MRLLQGKGMRSDTFRTIEKGAEAKAFRTTEKGAETKAFRTTEKGSEAKAFRTIEALMDCIERLMALLRESVKADEAQRIYREFFGNGDLSG